MKKINKEIRTWMKELKLSLKYINKLLGYSCVYVIQKRTKSRNVTKTEWNGADRVLH